ncbi:hypothetical protein IW261DRAFT_1639051 [Armillaria novae-zelandiae]|uniref:DUF6533 domain-containing protein n=1 Tax=Armillaria novae-zelandiae TaxID=153914 RepID=A0AA39UQN8_9AGAR|nr:hypothetical protein IW261DRAFT_1639051 [Armillaria novae-zelandiae]
MAPTYTESVTTHFLQFRIQYASIALLYYDYILTLPMEIKYIWGSKFRLSTVLYLCCRYALVANVLYLLAIASQLGARHALSLKAIPCDTWYKIIAALSVIGRAAVIVTFTARTYAIFARSKAILLYLAAVGLTCIILDIMQVPDLRCIGSTNDQFGNCSYFEVRMSRVSKPFTIESLLLSILLVVFEYSSAILMTIRSIQAFRISGSWNMQRQRLLYVIFEQGRSQHSGWYWDPSYAHFFFRYLLLQVSFDRLYYTFETQAEGDSVVTLFTTAAVVLNSVASAGFPRRLLNALTLPLSGLLTARFLLQLRAWEHKQSALVTGSDRQTVSNAIPPIEFRVLSVIDEFGEDLVSAAERRQSEGEYVLEEVR